MPKLHEACSVDELEDDGSRLITEISGREVAIIRQNGEYHAVLNYCVHQAGPLCEGQLTGQTLPGDDGWSWDYDDNEKYVTCPWHGWKFDIESGENVDSDEYSVPVYETTVENGTVYVEL